MKKIFLILLILSVFSIIYSSNEPAIIKYNDSWGENGYNLDLESKTGVEITYSIRELIFEDQIINGKKMTKLSIPGIFLPNDEGMPDLPGNGKYIAIPQGAVPKLKIISFRTDTYTDIDIAPAFRIPWETEKGSLEYKKNLDVYSKNAFYPEQPVILSEKTDVRGVDVIMLGITPFQYNPVTKELIVYRDIQVEISFIGGNGYFGEDRLRSRWWDPLLCDMLLNEQSLPEIDYSDINFRTREGAEYLIICPDDPTFLAWADSIKVFRTKQGILTVVKTTTEVGGNNATAIENYIDDAYTNWDPAPAAILLLGDYGTTGNTVVSPIYNNYCVSDNIYADVTGNMMPDVILARMTAQNETHLQTMITKFLNYERTPPENPDFYDNPITALGWQTERWFQICSETIGGFWANELGKSQVRINAIYEGNPNVDPWSTATNTSTVLNVFGPNGLSYIPATPQELGGWSGGNATMVNDAINSGAFMLQHRDHGSESGWGEPSYHSGDIDNLTNTDLIFIFSINCLTGKFNMTGECFAEKFHRYTYNGENSGALGLIAASEVSYSFVNDTFVWGMYDNMWPEFMPAYGTTPESRGILPAFGNAAGKYFLQQSNWPYNSGNKAVTYNLFHHHGDAFSTVYSEMPQNLTIVHDPVLLSGVNFFEVTANYGSLIALSVDGELIGVAEGTGAPVEILIPVQPPNNNMQVTVTKQNYYRYSAEVVIISPDQYVICDSVSFIEIGGYIDGSIQSLDTLQLDITLHNIGQQPTGNVVTATLSTNSSYINILDDYVEGTQIPAYSSVVFENAFQIELLTGITDNTIIEFEVEVSSDNETWISDFELEVHAPQLVFDSFELNVTCGDDQILDPGETGEIYISFENIGSGYSYNAAVSIFSSDPYVTLYGDDVIPIIEPGEVVSTEQPFTVEIAENSPVEYFALIDVYALDELELTCEGSFNLPIGFIVFNFEEGEGEWEHYSLTTGYIDEWHLSSFRNHTEDGSYSMKCGGENGANYSNYIHAALVMPEIELTSSSFVKFHHWMDVGPENNPLTWDGGLVEISAYGGEWQQVEPVGGYPCTIINIPTSPFEEGTPVFAGSFDWEEVELDLSEYIGSVQLRFVFGSSGLITGEGWYIDDVYLINYTDTKDEFIIPAITKLGENYPNPFNPVTTISYSLNEDSKVKIEIYNIRGQKVKTLLNSEVNAGNHKIIWNGKDDLHRLVSSGVYFYKMRANKYSSIRKMLLMK